MDKNNNLKYDTKTEAIGFRNDTINLDKNFSGINLLLANANNEKPKNQKVEEGGTSAPNHGQTKIEQCQREKPLPQCERP